MDAHHGTIDARYGAVRFLLGRLDRHVTLQLFDHYADRPGADRTATTHLGDILLEVLNGRRRSHAQRLWTGWLEPALRRDDATLATDGPPPDAIHVVDARAWWAVLAARMPDEAHPAQEFVAARARVEPLDRVLESADAARWARRLLRRSLDELLAVREDPAACRAALAEASAVRLRLAAGRPVGRGALGRDDLDRLIALLRDAARRCRGGPT
ncbi:hypothetical protein [Azospirillum sp. ST 5-10]|uniref:hypothetical protein n=1 Tax=unclassified Azospirillum TaxID=2630922 RepID=UPI003F49C9C5